MTAVTLINPKVPRNVVETLRACSIFGVDLLSWTGTRVPHPDKLPRGVRLPREERMKIYRNVQMLGNMDPHTIVDWMRGLKYTPVAVEKRRSAESLDDFVHPERAVYIFGPEDGSLTPGLLHSCHRFVCIPTVTEHAPLNLAAAVNVVLYDRYAKLRAMANSVSVDELCA